MFLFRFYLFVPMNLSMASKSQYWKRVIDKDSLNYCVICMIIARDYFHLYDIKGIMSLDGTRWVQILWKRKEIYCFKCYRQLNRDDVESINEKIACVHFHTYIDNFDPIIHALKKDQIAFSRRAKGYLLEKYKDTLWLVWSQAWAPFKISITSICPQLMINPQHSNFYEQKFFQGLITYS